MRFRDRWRAVRDWSSRAWANIRPGPETRKGAKWGAIVVALFIAISSGSYLKLGYGLGVDLAFALIVTLLLVPLIALGVVLLINILRRVPRFETGMIVGALVLTILAFSPELGSLFGGILLLMECVLGATIATFLAGQFGEAHLSKKMITVVLFVAAIAGNVALFVFLSGTGTDKDILKIGQNASPEPPPLTVSNPADAGSNTVLTSFYGSGSDIRRPEYGKSVAIKTKTVDASLFIKDFKGCMEKLRHR